MSTSELQTELEQNLALRKEIAQKIRIILRLMEMLESGKYSPSSFYYVPFAGPSIFKGGAVIHPNIKILNRDLAYLIQMLKDLPKNMEELKFEKYKEWTQGEIDRYHQEAKRVLNKIANKQKNASNQEIDNETKAVFDDLISKSNSIIRYLCKILDREPTRKNMQNVLKEVAYNLLYGGDNTLGLDTVEKTTIKRLQWANNNYRPETDPRDFIKLAKAWEDACLFIDKHPLLIQVGDRLYDIAMSKKSENTKRNKEVF